MGMKRVDSMWKASFQTPVTLTSYKHNFLKGVPNSSMGFIKKQLLCV